MFLLFDVFANCFFANWKLPIANYSETKAYH